MWAQNRQNNIFLLNYPLFVDGAELIVLKHFFSRLFKKKTLVSMVLKVDLIKRKVNKRRIETH